MCGIWAYIDLYKKQIFNNNILFNNFMKIKHRGPEFTSFQIYNNVYVGFHRLSIMEPSFLSNQPYVLKNIQNNNTIVFICNGEIYNYNELITKYNLCINSNSDCLTIPYLYIFNNDIFNDIIKYEVHGEYAFILFEFDVNQSLINIIAYRDHIGIRPLYYYIDTQHISFSSEIKGMDFINNSIKEFEPGYLLKISAINNYNFEFIDLKYIYDIKPIYNKSEEYYLDKIKNALINSIKRRLIADKPIGFLLSGGVDSSLVASISSSLLNKQINTFCCGLSNGTDFYYAEKVAQHINSNHTPVIFTADEGLNAINDVIYTIESWDTTSIRASVGQYLVSKYIGTNTDYKVLLVGEGPDEICSSYLFNFYAPSSDELHNTALEYVKNIHLYDGRRADRCISKWGLEARIPFLDPEFIEAYWTLPSEWRHPNYKGIEKWWLRKAFENSNYLPDEILWRKKEAFSDGISEKNNSWFQIIHDFIETKNIINNNNSPSMEAAYYKQIFINYFKEHNINIIPSYWQPKWINNNNNYIDPSARILSVY